MHRIDERSDLMDEEKTGGLNNGMEQPEESVLPEANTADGETGEALEVPQDAADGGLSADEPEADAYEETQEAETAEPEAPDEFPEEPVEGEDLEPEEKKEPSKFGLFLRKVLRWAAGLGVVFIAGVLLMQFLVVSPLRKDLRGTKGDLEAAEAETAELQDDLADVRADNDALETENEELQDQLTTALADQQILRALADVSAARVALAEDDVVTAKAALSGTNARLETLYDLVPADVEETVAGMVARLELAVEELDDDTFAAENDLEVLWTNLQALEASLFQ